MGEKNEEVEEEPSNKEQIAVFAFMFPLLALEAVVCSDLWGWFAVPLGAPEVGTWQMCGLLILYAIVQMRPRKQPKDPMVWTLTFALMFLLLWGFGALCHVWMVG